jgi:hypothetical protein
MEASFKELDGEVKVKALAATGIEVSRARLVKVNKRLPKDAAGERSIKSLFS